MKKWIIFITLFLILVIILILLKNTNNPNTSNKTWLHTNNGQILDENNQEFIIHGVNLPGLEFGKGIVNSTKTWKIPLPDQNINSTYNGNIYDAIKKAGFNTVRLPIAWANLEPTIPNGYLPNMNINQINNLQHVYDDNNYLKDVDYVINEFSKRNIRVILSIHQNGWSPAFNWMHNACIPGLGMPDWLYPAGCNKINTSGSCMTIFQAEQDFYKNQNNIQQLFLSMVDHLSKHYSQNTNLNMIGIDLLNEPSIKGKESCNANTSSYTPIASVNADSLYQDESNIILNNYKGKTFSPLIIYEIYDGSVIAPNANNLSNAVFSFHLYPDNFVKAKTQLAARIKFAKDNNVPLLLGEFTKFNFANVGEQKNLNDFISIFKDFLSPNKVSWMYFAASSPNDEWKYPIFRYTSGNIQTDNQLLNILQKDGMY